MYRQACLQPSQGFSASRLSSYERSSKLELKEGFLSPTCTSVMAQTRNAAQSRIGPLLRRHGATVATAESCTGGLIASLLTDVSGSSDYYLGGVIAYANEVKRGVLGVSAETLRRVGAVSQEAALQMARGARGLLGADYALSTTGIAGPTGGTAEKPVGLVYIALVGPDVERCERHIWTQDRLGNKQLSARRAMQMLIEHLERKS